MMINEIVSECMASLFEIEFNSHHPKIFQYTFKIVFNPHDNFTPVIKVDDEGFNVVEKKKIKKKKNTSNEGIKLTGQNHNAFYAICCHVLKKQFGDQIAHNGKETLYSLKKLNTNQKIINIGEGMAEIHQGTLMLSLKCIATFDFNNTNLGYGLNAEFETKAYALDIIISQNALKSDKYVPCGVGKLFSTKKENEMLGYGLEIREGCMKKIYRKKTTGKCYVGMDYIKHAFLPGGKKLSEAWDSFLNGREIKDEYITAFSNLYVGAKLQVDKVFTKIVVFLKLKQQGTYIQAQTSEGLYNLNDLLIVPFQIADGQKIPLDLHEKESTLNLLERKERCAKIQKQMKNLIDNDCKILKAFKIKNVSTEMFKCSFTTLQKSNIIIANQDQIQTELTPDDKGKIDYVTNHYILPGDADDFFIQTDGSKECIKLAQDIEERMTLRGLKTTNTWTQKIESETFNQKPFALIINREKWPREMNLIFEKTNNRALHIHWQEDLDIEILVTKINLIMGGWCHNATFEKQLDLNDGNIFVISVDTQICHATKKQHLFVAISSNFDLKYPYKFSGCSFIQEAVYKEKASTRSPNADVLKTVVKGMLTSAQRNIEKVIFLRNEVATQYAEEEMKCIKEAVDEIFPETKIKFAGMVVSKGGKIRHFYEHNGFFEDVPLYSMIYFDDHIFFMVSAVSSEDSIKACEINVFESEDISLNELQKFLMALTTHHQSIFPTGQPAPCMKSKEHIKNAENAFKDSNFPSGDALKNLNLKLCPFLIS